MKLDLKLDAAQLKGLLAKLSVLKVYSAFILPSILAAVALFLLLIPAPLLSSRLKNNINRMSVNSGRQLASLSSEQISPRHIEVEREYQDLYAKDANEIVSLVRQTTLRELLSYQIFPEPNDTSVLIFHDFAKRYRDSIEELVHQVNGREQPAVSEIIRNLKKSGSDTDRLSLSADYSIGAGKQQLPLDRMTEIERTIIDELCRSTAQSGLVYVNITEVPGYNYWDIGAKSEYSQGARYQYQTAQQSVKECWYWQLGYWIIEDIFQTISAMNADCQNILNCPVKRLVSIEFGSKSQAGYASTTLNYDKPPGYVASPKDYLVMSFTKRVSGEKIDVVHFRLSVLVSADAVMPFMNELCSSKEHIFRGWKGAGQPRTYKHNQITILLSRAEPIKPDTRDHQLYRYGDDLVFQLDLVCEYIFESKVYQKIKPTFLNEDMTLGTGGGY